MKTLDAFVNGCVAGIIALGLFMSAQGFWFVSTELFKWSLKPRYMPPGYILTNDGNHWYFVMVEKGHYLTNWSGGPGKQDVIDHAWQAYHWNHP